MKAKHWYINAVNDSILSGEDTYCYQPRSSAPCCWLCGGGLSIVSILLGDVMCLVSAWSSWPGAWHSLSRSCPALRCLCPDPVQCHTVHCTLYTVQVTRIHPCTPCTLPSSVQTLTCVVMYIYLLYYILESIGRGSSHNIEVGPHAHDSKDNSLHHYQGKFWCKM